MHSASVAQGTRGTALSPRPPCSLLSAQRHDPLWRQARFERPAGLFGTWGTGNVGGAAIGSDDPTGANRGPEHTVNPTPRAGDVRLPTT